MAKYTEKMLKKLTELEEIKKEFDTLITKENKDENEIIKLQERYEEKLDETTEIKEEYEKKLKELMLRIKENDDESKIPQLKKEHDLLYDKEQLEQIEEKFNILKQHI